MAKKKPVRVSTFTLHKLQERYPFVMNVEQTIPHTFIKRDLFGFADYEAFNSMETVLVQVTTKKNLNARIEKILASSEARLWVTGDNRRILVHGWSKVGLRGQPKEWQLTEVEIDADSAWTTI